MIIQIKSKWKKIVRENQKKNNADTLVRKRKLREKNDRNCDDFVG